MDLGHAVPLEAPIPASGEIIEWLRVPAEGAPWLLSVMDALSNMIKNKKEVHSTNQRKGTWHDYPIHPPRQPMVPTKLHFFC